VTSRSYLLNRSLGRRRPESPEECPLTPPVGWGSVAVNSGPKSVGNPSVAIRSNETLRASWWEGCSAHAAIDAISARVKTDHVVDTTESGLTIQYGSPAKFRLMGGLFTSRWFPLTAKVAVAEDGGAAEVEVVAIDRKDAHLADISIGRRERSIGEWSYISQFRRFCAELGGSGRDQ